MLLMLVWRWDGVAGRDLDSAHSDLGRGVLGMRIAVARRRIGRHDALRHAIPGEKSGEYLIRDLGG